MDKRVGAFLGVIALVAVIIVVLVTGGSGTSSGDDAGGDVAVEGEGGAPTNADLADVAKADVRREGDEILFVAEMAMEIPEQIEGGSLEFRWDLSIGGRDAWIISALVATDTTAAVTAQQTNYGSSTIDDTMPGSVEADGTTLTIALRPGNIDAFPDAFSWRLRTTLDGDRADPKSPVAHDEAPDGGPGQFQ